jgi:hypothetical protein
MRIFLAGATGAIGKRLVPQLIVHGHQVIATTRSAAKVDALRALGAEPVVVDGLDAVAVGEAVARAEPEAIIHQMTALAGTPDMKLFDRWFATTNQLRTRGTEHLLAAAQAARSRLRRARARRRPGGRSRSGRRRSGKARTPRAPPAATNRHSRQTRSTDRVSVSGLPSDQLATPRARPGCGQSSSSDCPPQGSNRIRRPDTATSADLRATSPIVSRASEEPV